MTGANQNQSKGSGSKLSYREMLFGSDGRVRAWGSGEGWRKTEVGLGGYDDHGCWNAAVGAG